MRKMLKGALVLAAGTSSRMDSRISKLLQPVAGKPMILWVKEALTKAGAQDQVYVVGYQQAEIRKTVGENMIYMLQNRPLGTGHATAKAASFLEGVKGEVLVCPADIPLIRPQTLINLVNNFSDCACAFISAEIPKAANLTYEEVIRSADHRIIGLKAAHTCNLISDFFDAASGPLTRSRYLTPQKLKETVEVSSGIYCFDTSLLLSALGKIGARMGNDKTYELSDIIRLLLADGHQVKAIPANSLEVLGVKTRPELDDAAYLMNQRICAYHMNRGVTIIDPDSCIIDYNVSIGSDSVIGPQVVLTQGTQISNNCRIGAFSSLQSAFIGENTKIERAVLQECKLGQDNLIEPFTEIRQSVLGDNCRVESFTLLKNSQLADNVIVHDHSSLAFVQAEKLQEFKSGTIIKDYRSQKLQERQELENRKYKW